MAPMVYNFERRKTPRQAAEYLRDLGFEGMSEKVLQNKRTRRKGPAYLLIDGRIYYTESDLLAWARGIKHFTTESLSRPVTAPIPHEAS